MALLNCFILFSGLWLVAFCDQDGFLSLSCGGTKSYIDSSQISWVSDSAYINTGNTTSTIDNVPLRFFPDFQGRKCYRLPVKNVSSLVLVRARFVYKNYDGLSKPPSFSASLGTAIATTIDLATNDPWTPEFVWPVNNKDTLSFCLHSIPDGGSPVISSLEVRPQPLFAYQTGMEDFPNHLLRKSYRINSGHVNASLRYPEDPYDRIWDADEDYAPFHLSSGFNTLVSLTSSSSIQESPPAAVLQNARVLARKDALTYNFPLDMLGDYYIVLYFAGILPVSPTFSVLINGDVAESNYTVRSSESGALYLTRKGIKSLNITIKSISFNPQVNALEVYEIIEIPSEASSTTVSALEVIQQSTGLDLGWQDDPCSPTPWDHIGCEGSLVTSLIIFISALRNWNAARVFSYKEIKSATNNFKEVIGRGSFGSVYLGKLADGKSVAVKVRFDRTQLGADSFINEVCLLSQVGHQNLVSLEGFCHESKQQILVYEYLPGGSLADHLYGPNSKKLSLSWVRRLKIAVDAAKGLDYLHNGSEPRIIHRDVKCSNILLDRDMNAKVCDFGLSKQVTQADATHVTTVVKGTAGYLDPEYYSTQQLTEKSDVYSFGVVLLELICGREPLSHSGTPDSFNLVLWAKPYLQAGTFEIVDESIKASFDAESMRKAALVAVRSVERDASQRPTIAERSPIPIRVYVAPSSPPFATESVSTTQQFGLRPEVPIWDGDNGIPDTFIFDEQKRVDANDSYSSDGDEIHKSQEVFTSPDDDNDLDGQDDVDTNTRGHN
ncbi:hypothetical protein LWI29_036747 [Acer saccharum]|uniref:Protein kinase domain-containing protein n=1 Tax=Acer saccharum TaxID=4024 RepID=A0AA39S1U6_ACESA|nr:hypothetical protein LWI29_036747 [Acer saccharum]